MPAADETDDVGRILVAHAHERFDCAGVVLLAGEDHIGGAVREFRHILEQRAVVALHAFEMCDQRGGEGGRIGEAREFREPQQAVSIGR